MILVQFRFSILNKYFMNVTTKIIHPVASNHCFLWQSPVCGRGRAFFMFSSQEYFVAEMGLYIRYSDFN